MPPNRSPQAKKRKLARSEQTVVQRAIDKLAALDLTFSSVPRDHASDLIAPLRPGIGLLGTAEEEQAYYAQYVQDTQRDEEQRPTDRGISGADLDDAQVHNPSDHGEDDVQLKQIQMVHHHEDKMTAAEEDPDEGIDVRDQDRL